VRDCRVTVEGNDIDVTIFPLFLAPLGRWSRLLHETKVVSPDPDTGLIDQGIYRFADRSKNETNIDAETRAEPRFNKRAADLKPVGARLQGPSR
jgi:hypothetical protein